MLYVVEVLFAYEFMLEDLHPSTPIISPFFTFMLQGINLVPSTFVTRKEK